MHPEEKIFMKDFTLFEQRYNDEKKEFEENSNHESETEFTQSDIFLRDLCNFIIETCINSAF